MGVGDSAPLPRSSTAAPPPPSLVLVLRQLDIFSTAARAFADYKLTSWRADQQTDAAAAGALWDAAHERNAALLARTFLRLEGLWVKLGQYLSSRADVMPAAYLRALARCQDALPPPPWAETAATLQSELGRPLAAVFTSVERTPLAVASIASVHRATLLDGSPVVVKVQHARVRARLLLDLRCLEAIGRIIRWLDPDLDLSPVVREWAREVPKELDFVNEAANTAAVARNLAPLALLPPGDERAVRVRVARVVPGLTSGRLLVLSFVDGFKARSVCQGRSRSCRSSRRLVAQCFEDGNPNPKPNCRARLCR